MSDDDDSVLLTLPFSFTGPVPPFFTRSHRRTRTFSTPSTETPTDLPPSTPVLSTPFDVGPPPTQTDDPAETDVSPSDTRTLDTPTPTSQDSDPSTLTPTDVPPSAIPPGNLISSTESPLDPSVTDNPSPSSPDLSSPTNTPDSSNSGLPDDPFSSASPNPPLTTDPSDSTVTTPDSSPTTLPPLPSPTPVPPTTTTPNRPTSLPIPLSQLSPSRSFSSTVTTTSFPSFSGGATPQSRAATSTTGMIVAATTGAVALAIILALLTILCRKRHLKKLRQHGSNETFALDLDGEMEAVNQPLIVGDVPSPRAGVYAEPFTDDSRQRTQSGGLSLTPGPSGPTTSTARSNNSSQAVIRLAPITDPRGGSATEYNNYHQPTDRLSPPPLSPPPGVARARSPSLQTRYPPEPPIPRQSSPSFDAGAVAYLRHCDQVGDTSPPSPRHYLPGNAEDYRLISAFSASSGLSPQRSTPAPPPEIDEVWRSSPDPIQASSSYRPPIDRRRSFRPNVSGHELEHGDTVVISPLNIPTRPPPSSFFGPGWHDGRGKSSGSRPSPIAEVTEAPSHSHEESSNSGGTWNSNRSIDSSLSTAVVMHAHRVRITPTALSIVSPLTQSSGSNYGESLTSPGSPSQIPSLPQSPVLALPPIQPLSLGKKRSAQGAS